ncbi:helix-turn-helix domain-containing protein [Evansella halocellulosilytica]|uniref:helix-turn-helix domain-containing protein n=1 Tax=Evansella halocellulosilytica TaxID=2011013 RepID=UPI000BB69D31|nr:helix-turn-helix domain-containing protein [Evansella halocellulosilytica]
MTKQSFDFSFEELFQFVVKDEVSQFVRTLGENEKNTTKKYLTLQEVSQLTGIGTYTLRQLTFTRAMPHRKVLSRLIFLEDEITETINNYKKYGWTDPDNKWDVSAVQAEIESLRKEKEESPMIEDIFRKIIREELNNFSDEIKSESQKKKESYYGRTVLTIKEAANHFRTSPATVYGLIKEEGMPHFKIHSRYFIVLEEAEAYLWRETAKSYAIEGNIYWQRILERLDWEEKERNAAYEKALKRLEESTF